MITEQDEITTPIEREFIATRQKLITELDKTKASIDKLERDIYSTRHAPKPREQVKAEIFATLEARREEFGKTAKADIFSKAVQGGHTDLLHGYTAGRYEFRAESILFFCWDSVIKQVSQLIEATQWPELYPHGLTEDGKAEIIGRLEEQLETLLLRRDRILSILREQPDDSHE
jgi:hypothetical protein